MTTLLPKEEARVLIFMPHLEQSPLLHDYETQGSSFQTIPVLAPSPQVQRIRDLLSRPTHGPFCSMPAPRHPGGMLTSATAAGSELPICGRGVKATGPKPFLTASELTPQ